MAAPCRCPQDSWVDLADAFKSGADDYRGAAANRPRTRQGRRNTTFSSSVVSHAAIHCLLTQQPARLDFRH